MLFGRAVGRASSHRYMHMSDWLSLLTRPIMWHQEKPALACYDSYGVPASCSPADGNDIHHVYVALVCIATIDDAVAASYQCPTVNILMVT